MTSTRRIEKAYSDFFASLFPEGATHWFGVSLAAPDRVHDVERHNDLGKDWRRQLVRHSINFIDKAVYGRKYFETPDRFDFQARVEGRSKSCMVVPAHIHCAMDLNEGRDVRFLQAWPTISQRIAKIGQDYGYRFVLYAAPVTDVEGLMKYMTKWAIHDADVIYTRGTL